MKDFASRFGNDVTSQNTEWSLFIVAVAVVQLLSRVQLLCDTMDFSPPWDFPDKNTSVGCHFLLQGIFLTQESNLHRLFGRWILYHWATWEAPCFSLEGFYTNWILKTMFYFDKIFKN